MQWYGSSAIRIQPLYGHDFCIMKISFIFYFKFRLFQLSLRIQKIGIMSTEEIKLQIFRQVDALDASKLKEFYGVMLNFVNSKKEDYTWGELSEAEKKGIQYAIDELNAGKGIPHNQVMSRLRDKYSHA